MTRYEEIQKKLRKSPKTWLVTGVAGFIGSHLLETLLKLDQSVVGLDNFATGHQRNLDEVQSIVSIDQWKRFKFTKGDIRSIEDCKFVCEGVDYVLHQAALGSVPRSLVDPIATNETNITGFLNMLIAARDAQVQSFTYAASSSTYGDHPALPKVEENIGNPLSPYGVTKYVNELYASVFARSYGFKSIGLRYFNVFGSRQDPQGDYAAVIPKWTASLLQGEQVFINGDGETTRDFCYVANAVQANLLAACGTEIAKDQVYNVAVGERNSLNDLFHTLRNSLLFHVTEREARKTIFQAQQHYRDFRLGDVRHSQANVEKAVRLLGYKPAYQLAAGLTEATPWYVQNSK